MRARKLSDPGGGPSSGRIGLAVLVATVAAFLLVGVAQAAAESVVVNINGSGSGEVTSVATGGLEPGVGGGSVACSYNGETKEQSGVCTDSVINNKPTQTLYAYAAAGTQTHVEWAIEKGVDFWGAHAGEPCGTYDAEGITLYGGPYCVIEEVGGEVEATVTFCLEGQSEAECLAVPPPEPNLKVNIEEGEGTVVSSPSGIECEPTCEAEFEVGSKVTLTASPAPGYLFKSWKKCDTGGVNGRQCTVTIPAEGLKEVGAKFVKVFSLEGSKSGGLGIMGTTPGGINCGYACSSSTALYKEGGLTVKAKPAKHFHFVEFTGGTGAASSCTGVTELTCTIASFNSNSAIEEVYAEDAKNALTLAKTGGGQGSVKTKPANLNCGYTCTAAAAEFYASETALVLVKLNKGTSSIEWSTGAGTCTGKVETLESSCEVPMSAAHELVAKFE